MKKLAALTLSTLVLAASPAYAVDWKKQYCGGQEYIPSGSKYPHLHCGKDFYTYSKTSSNHANMVNGDQANCGIVRSTIDNIKALPDSTAGKTDMLNSVLSMARDYCKK